MAKHLAMARHLQMYNWLFRVYEILAMYNWLSVRDFGNDQADLAIRCTIGLVYEILDDQASSDVQLA